MGNVFERVRAAWPVGVAETLFFHYFADAKNVRPKIKNTLYQTSTLAYKCGTYF